MELHLHADLDTAYLQRIYGDDKEIIVLLFKAFLSDSVEKWKLLKPVIDNNDFAEAASIIHTIKPSFLMAGISVLKPAVMDLEVMIKAKNKPESILVAHAALDVEIKRFEQILIGEIIRLENS